MSAPMRQRQCPDCSEVFSTSGPAQRCPRCSNARRLERARARAQANGRALAVGPLRPEESAALAQGICPDCLGIFRGRKTLQRGPLQDGGRNLKCQCGAGFRAEGTLFGLALGCRLAHSKKGER